MIVKKKNKVTQVQWINWRPTASEQASKVKAESVVQ